MTANTIKSYSFDRNSVKAGILHFGVGNFHRAHLEYMTSHLLEDPTQHGWGICGAMILERETNRCTRHSRRRMANTHLPYVGATVTTRFTVLGLL